MTEVIRLSRKQVVFPLAGVLVTAFLGILVGSYSVRFRMAMRNGPGENLLLRVGQIFPDYKFAGLNPEQPDLSKNLEEKKSVLIFLTTDCGHCLQVINRWDSLYLNIRHAYQVVGISFEPMGKLKTYQADKGLKIPLYNDPDGKFTGKYKIDSYPTILGVNEKREIAFIEFGNRPKKSVEDYLRRL